ncbi:hypothetical protein [Jatrophihabitans sp.]|uniref:hypothetical protein n=1 Tax=Jatrophihabitans sp. TaxID=1932789 RepID=UPI0030C68609|nr:hypothetical protein [Jatrophihabitans sp.]
MADPSSELSALLGCAPPPSVAALPADTLDRLASQLTAARRAQDVALEGSINSALKAVPLPLRGVVKKVLLG